MRNRYPIPTASAAGSPLDQARAAFDWLTRGPHPFTVDGRVFAGLPARAVRLDELRDRLHDRRFPGPTRDAVWSLLVQRARVEAGVWTIACVGCALPALTATGRKLSSASPACESQRRCRRAAHPTRQEACRRRRPPTPLASGAGRPATPASGSGTAAARGKRGGRR
jgi:hypothetical protein